MSSDKLISLGEYPVNCVLKELLKDRTTGKNIIFATNTYSDFDAGITEKTQITEDILKVLGERLIQPRVSKAAEEQMERTRKKAEVFTPSWICNKMNNHCDKEWFGRDNVFNIESEQGWEPVLEPVRFEGLSDWQKYVDSKRLEITCGEAPYIVSRYDASTGDKIDVTRRIGILDRKLRVINENTVTEKEWMKWVLRAFQSVYGYEFQGDNLLIARINLLITFVDYMQYKWNRIPTNAELKKVTNIIVWNIWQMDGITGTVPFGKPQEEYKQITFFDFMQGINDTEPEEMDCVIYDWQSNKQITFRSIKEGT
ncbi:hypothetical protein [Butyrivibrio sp. AD3002]|uniref:hypothetical protein n=1 Tax=Butyrivibrio sp. AD3002 TaxID=1280670 RepID=UPI0003B33556|nr:hypothetical protein [Butyrivibrio sp. AD3002]